MSGERRKVDMSKYARGGSQQPMQIAGRPADVCPYCGCAMFANGRRDGESMIFRYVVCRNESCGATFTSKQPQAVLVREVGSE